MLNTLGIGAVLPNLADTDPARWLTAADMFHAATAAGAAALGAEARLGRIAVGMTADLVGYRLDSTVFTPLNDPVRQLVYAERGANLALSVVDGRVVIRDGKLQGVDEVALLREAQAAHAALIGDLVASQADTRALQARHRGGLSHVAQLPDRARPSRRPAARQQHRGSRGGMMAESTHRRGGHRLTMSRVSHAYLGVPALSDISLEVAPGSLTALLGPSGCGKTTLLRVIAGFLRQTAGSVLVDGAAIDGVPPVTRHIGIVFQNYALFPHMSVARNIGYGLRARGHRGPHGGDAAAGPDGDVRRTPARRAVGRPAAARRAGARARGRTEDHAARRAVLGARQEACASTCRSRSRRCCSAPA